MAYAPHSKISISVPKELLDQVDELVKRNFASRSTVIRLALLEYVRQHNPQTDGPAQLTEEVLEKMRQEFPQVDPNDIGLLQFLTYYKYVEEK